VDLSARQEVVIIDFDYTAITWDDTQENSTVLSTFKVGSLSGSTLFDNIANAISSNKHVILRDQDGFVYYYTMAFFAGIIFSTIIPNLSGEGDKDPIIAQIIIGESQGNTQIAEMRCELNNIGDIEETTAAALNDLHNSLDNKLSWDDTVNTLDRSTKLPTSNAVYYAI